MKNDVDVKKNIALVDDNPLILKLLTRVLDGENYNFFPFKDGKKFMMEVRKQPDYDLVVLDLILGESITGFEVLNVLKKNLPDVPVLVITQLDHEKDFVRAFHEGAWDYVVKPFGKTEVQTRVKNLLRIHFAEKKLGHYLEEYQMDLELAGEIQKSSLPPKAMLVSNTLFVSEFIPSTHVGGDILDISPLRRDGTFFMIGDISGHGLQASLMMMSVKASFGQLISKYRKSADLANIARELNDSFFHSFQNRGFFTMVLGHVNEKGSKMRILTCGHPQMTVIDRKKAEVKTVKIKGTFPLGWQDSKRFDFPIEEYRLEEEKIYLFYTDGLTEQRLKNKNELGELGLQQLANQILQEQDSLLFPTRMCRRVLGDVFERQEDDFTIFALSKLNAKERLVSFHFFWGESAYQAVREVLEKDLENVLIPQYLSRLQAFLGECMKYLFYFGQLREAYCRFPNRPDFFLYYTEMKNSLHCRFYAPFKISPSSEKTSEEDHSTRLQILSILRTVSKNLSITLRDGYSIFEFDFSPGQ